VADAAFDPAAMGAAAAALADDGLAGTQPEGARSSPIASVVSAIVRRNARVTAFWDRCPAALDALVDLNNGVNAFFKHHSSLEPADLDIEVSSVMAMGDGSARIVTTLRARS